MNPDDIAAYLAEHPEFFEQHSELLAGINLANPHGDSVVSLGERQVGVLRDKQRQLEAKMAELLRFGVENDAIGEKVHGFALALVSAHGFAEVVRALYSDLGAGFGVPHVALRLWGIGGGGEPEYAPVSASLRDLADSLRDPYCGSSHGQEATAWFGERGAELRSLAQVPLRVDGACVGLLVLASEDAGRFHSGMGVLYLNRIGEMTAAALRRSFL